MPTKGRYKPLRFGYHAPMHSHARRLVLAAALLAAIVGFYLSGLGDALSLATLKAHQSALQEYVTNNPLTATALFAAAYIATTALSLPVAALLTLLAGALFGVVWGTLIASFASTAGATLAMLAARYLFGNSLQSRYGPQLARINAGFQKEGAFYLFALRLVPVVPFFLVNVLMGLVPVRTATYFWVSQLGMLPGTAAYVYAGTALAGISSLKDIASPQLLLAFALLGLLPLATRKALLLFRRKDRP